MPRAGSSALPLPVWLAAVLAAVFGALAALRRALYGGGWLATESVPVPVVVVGNITVGGTGKTPLAAALVAALGARGRRVGIVSRGYASRASRSARPVLVDSLDARHFGDEVVLLAKQCQVPIAVGRDRVAAARLLLASHPDLDLIVTDDGLQHYRLARSCEIAVVDSRGVGNGALLPQGILREPPGRLASVDAIVTNGPVTGVSWPTAVPRFAMELVAKEAYRLGEPQVRRPLESFRGALLLAAAGIGVPERFFAMLRSRGLSVDPLPLPDHFDFAENPFAERTHATILITEKDAVKCAPGLDDRIWVVPVRAVLAAGLVDLVLGTADGSARSRSPLA